MRVLIAEDESDLASVLKRLLQDAGYSADIAEDGHVALALALDEVYDLVVLDLMLPGLDGEDILGELRRRGLGVPILVLTARDEVGDRVRLLDAGADDYLGKPFEPAELVSRCRALVRRAAGKPVSTVTVGDVEIDMARRRVWRDGQVVPLTARQFRVLEYLVLHQGRVVTRQELMAHLYSDDDDTVSNVFDVYVSALRRHLGATFIETRRGHGFIIDR